LAILEAEPDVGDPLGNDVAIALEDGSEIGQHYITRAAGIATLRLNLESGVSDDVRTTFVTGASDVRNQRNHVDCRGIAARGGIEQGDVPSRRDDSHRRAGSIGRENSGLLNISFRGATGEREGKQSGRSRRDFEQAQSGILELC
jgi:hypothetical protein